jgi:lipopolysaccharide transport system ATP-binding protein
MPAITVDKRSKQYRLPGYHPRPDTLRDVLSGAFRRKHPGSDERSTHWALREVSFEVPEGQAIGIIGRNGAGKSTLLKILSRIVEPTSGRARMRGRVASLLEVGTGFHPELTGRENIYLCGTILGMKRLEIDRHFDDIVTFAEIEQFLDTPVKRYSSGMYVRLAFAVAAHLTPEILIVDEVLAVGDYEFQRRCLGRMTEVAHSGRTVLFVSHNMAAVESLCPTSILLKKGRVEQVGPTHDIVAKYLSAASSGNSWTAGERTEREGTGHARIVRVELFDADSSTPLQDLLFRQTWKLRMHFRASRRLVDPRFGFALLSDRGERVFQTETSELNHKIEAIDGTGHIDCSVDTPNLLPGRYYLELWIVEKVNVSFADHIFHLGQIDVSVNPAQAEQLAYLTHPGRGRVLMDCTWSHHIEELVHAD